MSIYLWGCFKRSDSLVEYNEDGLFIVFDEANSKSFVAFSAVGFALLAGMKGFDSFDLAKSGSTNVLSGPPRVCTGLR